MLKTLILYVGGFSNTFDYHAIEISFYLLLTWISDYLVLLTENRFDSQLRTFYFTFLYLTIRLFICLVFVVDAKNLNMQIIYGKCASAMKVHGVNLKLFLTICDIMWCSDTMEFLEETNTFRRDGYCLSQTEKGKNCGQMLRQRETLENGSFTVPNTLLLVLVDQGWTAWHASGM